MLAFVREQISRIDTKVKLKYVSQVMNSRYIEPKPGPIPMIRSQNIVNRELIGDNLITVDKSSSHLTSQKGDILVTSFGSKAGEHCINQFDFKTYVHSSIYVIRIDNNKVNLKYINYLLKTLDLEGIVEMNKFKYHIPRLNISEIREAKIKLPSMTEQLSLAQLFEEKEKELESDILKIKRKTHSIVS